MVRFQSDGRAVFGATLLTSTRVLLILQKFKTIWESLPQQSAMSGKVIDGEFMAIEKMFYDDRF